MVAQLAVIIILILTWPLRPLQAVKKDNINATLIDAMVTHLSGSPGSDLDAWTNQMSVVLEKEQQERLAWNVPWLKVLEEMKTSRVGLQKKLKPTNFLKTRIWQSFYYFLRRHRALNKQLLANCALELRDFIWNHPKKWNYYLQNMLQSLPRPLRILTHSRMLCLQHKREMFYVSSGYHLELGANDHCSMWQVQVQEARQDYMLLLLNTCNQERYFYINMLEDYLGSYQLLRPTGYMNNTFCVVKGLAYFRESSNVSESDFSCRWQINDCSYLPNRLSGDKAVKKLH